MGIEYSTPLVALTSAWFYISGEIVQISIRQKPKRRKRLSSHYVQGIWTGSLPHCLQLFPSRLAAWSSTNCLQRYIKNPELPSNSGDFFVIYMITICRDSLTRGKTLQADVILFYLSFQAFLYCQDMPAPQAKVFSAGIYDIRLSPFPSHPHD